MDRLGGGAGARMDRPGLDHDMTEPTCDTAGHRATTRPRHGWPGPGCAPGAPNPVLTQCTVLSHCLGHCS